MRFRKGSGKTWIDSLVAMTRNMDKKQYRTARFNRRTQNEAFDSSPVMSNHAAVVPVGTRTAFITIPPVLTRLRD